MYKNLLFIVFLCGFSGQLAGQNGKRGLYPPNPYREIPEIRKSLVFEKPEIGGKSLELGFNEIAQDEQGFLWFAYLGLERYCYVYPDQCQNFDEFSFVPRGKIKAKNKGEIEMYFVK